MLSIKTRLAGLTAAGAIAVAGVAGFVTPASAAQVPARTGLAAAAPAALPNTNIQGSPAAWSPSKLTVKPKSFTKCTAKTQAWTITNKTKKAAAISYKIGTGKKTTLGSLPAGEKAGICSEGKAGTKESFYIKGSTSVLTLTLS
jgi:hypothetical protein